MSRKNRRQHPDFFDPLTEPVSKKRNTPIIPRTQTQEELLSQLVHNQLVFAVGPAGTGKTYVATKYACEMLSDREIERIIVTRPMVTADEDFGFLPGGINEKWEPYFKPFREVMEEHFGRSHLANLIKNGRVEIAPIAFLRGHTFKDAFVILDEAQNTTPGQMKLFVTRIGENCTVCVAGDTSQSDFDWPNGLEDALHRFKSIPGVAVVEFNQGDVVRSPLVKTLLSRY